MREENEQQPVICSECGAVLTEQTSSVIDGEIYCPDCMERLTTTCDCCGRRILRCDAESDGCIMLCRHCYEYSYTRCEGCGCIVSNDEVNYVDGDDYPYCDECYRKLEEEPIKSYGYKPEPIFYGSGNLFYGVELEIDKGGERGDYAEEILNTANAHNLHLYAKHDGSIDDGFELVSHPMTLEYHTNTMNWSNVMDMALSLDYRSHQTQTCGLHIHVNRKAFGNDYDTQEDSISRIVHFVEMHWNELLKFSRRTEANMNRWASRYGISTTAKEKMYVYAGTEEILWRALIETEMFESIKSGSYEQVKISGGDILRISAEGELEYAKFNYTDYSGLGYCNWWNYGTGYGADKDYNNIYIEDLKSIAAYQGILPEDINFMLSQGFTVDEIEEYLYCCE